VVWRRLAEIVGEFVSKGSQLYVEGKLQTTSWQDRQSGEKKSRTEVVADDLVLLGSRDKRNEGQPPGSDQAMNAKLTHLPRAMVTGTAGWFFLYSILRSARDETIFLIPSRRSFISSSCLPATCFIPWNRCRKGCAPALGNPITWQIDYLCWLTIGLGNPFRALVESTAFILFALACFFCAAHCLERQE
jgi:hypothetical protein